MQRDVRGWPETHDLIRAYKARFGDQPVPQSDEDLREALGWDEMMDRVNRDERMSAVPDNFIMYEAPGLTAEHIRRTRDGLAALLEGDPEEHRESWEALRAPLHDERA